jgi:hypothetical protein
MNPTARQKSPHDALNLYRRNVLCGQELLREKLLRDSADAVCASSPPYCMMRCSSAPHQSHELCVQASYFFDTSLSQHPADVRLNQASTAMPPIFPEQQQLVTSGKINFRRCYPLPAQA